MKDHPDTFSRGEVTVTELDGTVIGTYESARKASQRLGINEYTLNAHLRGESKKLKHKGRWIKAKRKM